MTEEDEISEIASLTIGRWVSELQELVEDRESQSVLQRPWCVKVRHKHGS